MTLNHTTKSSRRDNAPPFTTFVAFTVVYLVGWMQTRGLSSFTGVRLHFTAPILDYLFFIGLQLIPFVLLAIAVRWRREWGLLIVAVPLVLIAAPVGCTASACVVLGGATNAAFERIHTFDAPHGRIAVYRTNGGATTAFGVIVDQECPIVPGVLMLAHPLLDEYPAYDATAVVSSAGVARVAVLETERPGLPSTLHFDVPICKFGCLCQAPNPVPIEQIPK